MPTFELTLKLCPYGLEVVVEAEVYVRGAETVTVLLYFVALAIAEFTEAGHEVPVAVEVNGETGTYAYRPAELAAGNCFLRSPVGASVTSVFTSLVPQRPSLPPRYTCALDARVPPTRARASTIFFIVVIFLLLVNRIPPAPSFFHPRAKVEYREAIRLQGRK